MPRLIRLKSEPISQATKVLEREVLGFVVKPQSSGATNFPSPVARSQGDYIISQRDYIIVPVIVYSLFEGRRVELLLRGQLVRHCSRVCGRAPRRRLLQAPAGVRLVRGSLVPGLRLVPRSILRSHATHGLVLRI